MRGNPLHRDTRGMRRIENMNTMMMDRAAIERQLDEIQHTFSARWEW
jgi:hypothetical protein